MYIVFSVSKTTPPFVLEEFFYTRYKQKENRKFLLTEAVLPPLTLTEEVVPLSVSPTDAVYFQDPDKIKETRFVYSEVFAKETCEILFSTISHSKYKIWLNGQYVGVCTDFSLFTFYLILKKGVNEFVFEIDLANPNYYDFNNRIALRSSEEANPQSLFYKSALEYDRWIQFFQTGDCIESDCTCIFIPRCYPVISSAVVKVLDDFGTL